MEVSRARIGREKGIRRGNGQVMEVSRARKGTEKRHQERKWAGQGNRQGTEVCRARKQAGQGNRQGMEMGRARKQAGHGRARQGKG